MNTEPVKRTEIRHFFLKGLRLFFLIFGFLCLFAGVFGILFIEEYFYSYVSFIVVGTLICIPKPRIFKSQSNTEIQLEPTKKNSARQGLERWFLGAGIAVFFVISLTMVLGILSQTGFLPPSGVLSKKEIPQDYIETLLSKGIISQGENITHFLPNNSLFIMFSGSLITESRLIKYDDDTSNNNLEIESVLLNDISSISLIRKGKKFGDSLYQVNYKDGGGSMQLKLSTDSNGDKEFIKALRKKAFLNID